MKPSVMIILIILFTGCSAGHDNLIENEKKTSPSSILNHEDTTDQYFLMIRKNHYSLHLTAENPVCIKTADIQIPSIYALSHINSSGTYEFEISSPGKINNFYILKKAGLGLDKIAQKIIKSSKFSPMHKEGLPEACKIMITINFLNGEAN